MLVNECEILYLHGCSAVTSIMQSSMLHEERSSFVAVTRCWLEMINATVPGHLEQVSLGQWNGSSVTTVHSADSLNVCMPEQLYLSYSSTPLCHHICSTLHVWNSLQAWSHRVQDHQTVKCKAKFVWHSENLLFHLQFFCCIQCKMPSPANSSLLVREKRWLH